MEDYKWKIIPRRLFGGGSEGLWGHALPRVGKMRFGSCVGEVAFPPSTEPTLQFKQKMLFFTSNPEIAALKKNFGRGG